MLYVSGHLHAELSENSFEKLSDNFYSLNLPSVQFTGGGGQGVVMDVYEECVLLKAVDNIMRRRLPEHDKRIIWGVEPSSTVPVCTTKEAHFCAP